MRADSPVSPGTALIVANMDRSAGTLYCAFCKRKKGDLIGPFKKKKFSQDKKTEITIGTIPTMT
jgi:hypothetical protein